MSKTRLFPSSWAVVMCLWQQRQAVARLVPSACPSCRSCGRHSRTSSWARHPRVWGRKSVSSSYSCCYSGQAYKNFPYLFYGAWIGMFILLITNFHVLFQAMQIHYVHSNFMNGSIDFVIPEVSMLHHDLISFCMPGPFPLFISSYCTVLIASGLTIVF